MSGTQVKRALVVGAGICGLGTATALSRRGIEVQLVELRSEPPVAGVGINQPGNSLRALRELGLFDHVRDAGFEIDEIEFRKPDGTLVVRTPYRLASEGIPHAIGIARRQLHEILIAANRQAGVDLRFGCTVDRIVEDGDGVHVEFTDGRTETFDLVVGADGINSTTRRLIFGERFEPQFTGAGVWRITVPRPPEVRSIGLYPVPGGSAGYIPLSATTMYLLRVCPEPYPARFDRERLPAMLRERLEPFGGLVAEIRDRIRDDDEVVYGPLHEVKLPPPWSEGRVVICGDAAHACPPHQTQGAAMAFEDAVVLAQELGESRAVADSLVAFSERRYPRVRFVGEASRVPLDNELALTADTLEDSFEFMRHNLPGLRAEVDAVLREAP